MIARLIALSLTGVGFVCLAAYIWRLTRPIQIPIEVDAFVPAQPPAVPAGHPPSNACIADECRFRVNDAEVPFRRPEPGESCQLVQADPTRPDPWLEFMKGVPELKPEQLPKHWPRELVDVLSAPIPAHASAAEIADRLSAQLEQALGDIHWVLGVGKRRGPSPRISKRVRERLCEATDRVATTRVMLAELREESTRLVTKEKAS